METLQLKLETKTTSLKERKGRIRRGKIKTRDGEGGRIETEKIRTRKTRKTKERRTERRSEREKEVSNSENSLEALKRNKSTKKNRKNDIKANRMRPKTFFSPLIGHTFWIKEKIWLLQYDLIWVKSLDRK